MRTIFAITLLSAYAQAIKVSSLTSQASQQPQQEPQPQQAAQQNSTSEYCAGYVIPEAGSAETYWGELFQGPSDWFNLQGYFWQNFNLSMAHQYFDCGYGNGDGLVSFQEVNDGLFKGGYTPDEDCSTTMQAGNTLFQTFQNTYNTTNSTTDNAGYGLSFHMMFQGQYNQMGFPETESLNFNDWMRNAVQNMGLSEVEAQTYWMAYYTDNQVITQQNFWDHTNDVTRGLWNFQNQQMVALGDYLPSDTWYTTQGCYSGESWWRALTNDQTSTAWQSTMNMDLNSWEQNHCTNMNMCEDGMKSQKGNQMPDSGSDSDSDSNGPMPAFKKHFHNITN